MTLAKSDDTIYVNTFVESKVETKKILVKKYFCVKIGTMGNLARTSFH